MERESKSDPEIVRVSEGRFARLEAIDWWDQERLARARVLVIGAGALGNEVIKNLSLLGIGHLVIVDMDRVERSNLSRSVLFRESDEGKPKAECAAQSARQIHPGSHAQAIAGNVLADVGLGYFRWANAVIGALDNREARLFVNRACAQVNRPWFDGGIDVLQGIVRGFAPPKTACYECTMGEVDWTLLNQRRSCSLLARRLAVERRIPTTATTASVIGAIQAQELVKLLHDRGPLLGTGFVFEGAEHNSYRVQYPIHPDCPWHGDPPRIEALPWLKATTRMEQLWHEAARRLGGLDAIDLPREMVEYLECPSCQRRAEIFRPAESISADQLLCPHCRVESAPSFFHSIAANSPGLSRTAQELGLPSWEVVWARSGTQVIGFEFAGDNPWPTATP